MKRNFSCDEILNNLSSYLDGELSEEENQMVENHLNSCDACKDEFKMLECLSGSIKNSLENTELEMPDFCDSVMNRLSTDKMTCEQVADELSAYFDAEVEPIAYYSIEEHLKDCSKCSDKYKQLEYLRKLIKLSVDSLDIDLWSKVYARLISPEELECDFVAKQLSAYLDKEVNGDLSKNISEHILACQSCRKEFEDLKLLQEKVQKALLIPMKGGNYWPAVQFRLIKESRKKTFALSTAASFLIMFLVWITLSALFPVNELTASDGSVLEVNEDKAAAPAVEELSFTDPKVVAVSGPTADSYMFSNTFNPPPSGVLPIMYQEDLYNDDY